MKIAIGKTIAELRREHGITQEQLAQAIGVSAPAVSKWENGQSYPDITLLPALARFFGVTVDALLAYQPALTDAERDALYEEINALYAQQGWDAAITRSEALLREYPDDGKLSLLLAISLTYNRVFAPTEAARTASKALQIAWLQAAMQRSDGEDRLVAKQQLAIAYIQSQRLDEAEEILTSLSTLEINAKGLMPTLRMLQGRLEEAEELAQRNLLHAVSDAVTTLVTLTGLATRQKNLALAAGYAQAAEDILDAARLQMGLRAMAAQAKFSVAMAGEDRAAQLSAVEAYADAWVQGIRETDAPLFGHLFKETETQPAERAQERATIDLLADDFEKNEALAALRGEPRFQSAVQRLRDASARLA